MATSSFSKAGAAAGIGAGIGYGVGKKNTPAPADPVVTNTPLAIPTVTPPTQAPYVPSSNTTSLADEARRQMRNAELISNARFRDNILKTIYGESDYGQFVIDDLATKEEARGKGTQEESGGRTKERGRTQTGRG